MPSTATPLPKGERTRARIARRAFDRANRLGLEGVTIGELATDLRVSKSGLYAHFRSKEALQLAVLDEAVERFVEHVVRPALVAPRGEPRVRALFAQHLAWIRGADRARGGGCFFMSATHEYDDRPGRVRDALVRSQRDWMGTVRRAAAIAIGEGHFRGDLDLDQFAYEFEGLGMAFHHAWRLMRDDEAQARAMRAFEALIERARTPVRARRTGVEAARKAKARP